MTVDRTAHRASRPRVPGRLHPLDRARAVAVLHRPARRPDRRRAHRRRAGDGAADRVRPDDRRRARRVRRGRSGRRRSTAWTWVAEPRRGQAPPRQAVRVRAGAARRRRHRDGARGRRRAADDDERRHARACRAGAAERVGYVTDLDAWVPDGRRRAARPAPDAGRRRRRAGHRHHHADPARVRDQRRASRRASTCAGSPRARSSASSAVGSDQVYVPPRGSDPTSGAPTEIEVEVADRRHRHHVLRREHPRAVGERARDPVRVRADPARRRATRRGSGSSRASPPTRCAWACGCRRSGPRAEARTPRSIKWFEPTGEPDAAYESYQEYA